jgi:hypothetical protein
MAPPVASKLPQREPDQPSAISDDIKNVFSFTYIPLYTFMACCSRILGNLYYYYYDYYY